jgi:transcriptional repressor NrdR
MRCPYCNNLDNRVLDSRTVEDGTAIRRRRECEKCQNRFTTYERVEESLLVVVKKDGKREKFDRQKILAGLVRACEKRPVTLEQMEAIVVSIVHQLRNSAHGEITADEIGNLVIEHLGRTDEVAYVRFASVYKEFKDVSSFAEELKILQQLRATVAPKTDE